MKLESKFSEGQLVQIKNKNKFIVGKIIEVYYEDGFVYRVEFLEQTTSSYEEDDLIGGRLFTSITYSDGESEEFHALQREKDKKEEIITHMVKWGKKFHGKTEEEFWGLFKREMQQVMDGNIIPLPMDYSSMCNNTWYTYPYTATAVNNSSGTISSGNLVTLKDEDITITHNTTIKGK